MTKSPWEAIEASVATGHLIEHSSGGMSWCGISRSENPGRFPGNWPGINCVECLEKGAEEYESINNFWHQRCLERLAELSKGG